MSTRILNKETNQETKLETKKEQSNMETGPESIHSWQPPSFLSSFQSTSSLSQPSYRPRTELTHFVAENNVEGVRSFLQREQSKGAEALAKKVMVYDDLSVRAVELAAELGNLEIFQLLVTASPNMTQNQFNGFTILDYAINPNTCKPNATNKVGKVKIAIFLLEKFPNLVTASIRKSHLCDAIRLGSWELFEVLCHNGLDVDGYTAKELKMLEEGKIHADKLTIETPLEIVIDILLKIETEKKHILRKIAEIEASYKDALREGKLNTEETLQVANEKFALAKKQASENLEDLQKQEETHQKILMSLVQAEADLNLGNKPPLFRAIECNSVKFVQFLLGDDSLTHPVFPNAVTKFLMKDTNEYVEVTPICMSLYHGSIESAKLLINDGARLNFIVKGARSSESVFYFAILGGLNSVQFFLENVGIKSEDLSKIHPEIMRKAVKLSFETQNFEVVEQLMEAGFRFTADLCSDCPEWKNKNNPVRQKLDHLLQKQQVIDSLASCFENKNFEEVLGQVQKEVLDLIEKAKIKSDEGDKIASQLLEQNFLKIIELLINQNKNRIMEALKSNFILQPNCEEIDPNIIILMGRIFALRLKMYFKAKEKPYQSTEPTEPKETKAEGQNFTSENLPHPEMMQYSSSTGFMPQFSQTADFSFGANGVSRSQVSSRKRDHVVHRKKH